MEFILAVFSYDFRLDRDVFGQELFRLCPVVVLL